MKKKGWLILCSVMMVFAVAGSVSADRSITLVVNGQTLSPDVPPQLVQNRTMVPVRWVAEALGATVDWDEAHQTVRVDTKDSSARQEQDEDLAAAQRQIELLQSWIAADSADAAAETWAEAVKQRNGAVQFAMLSPALQRQTGQAFKELNWSTGVSSPWIERYTITEGTNAGGTSRVFEAAFETATSTGSAGAVTVRITVDSSDQQWRIVNLEGDQAAEALTVLPSTAPSEADDPARVELQAYRGMQMIDPNTAFLWGVRRHEPALWRTDDGGERWDSVSLKGLALQADDLPSGLVYFLDSETGWISWSDGSRVKVAATADGGAHWSTVDLDGVLYPLQMSFINSKQGWFAASSDGAMSHTQKTIYRTEDGGRTWEAVSSDSGYVAGGSPTPDALTEVGYLRGMVFRTATEGYVTIANPVSSDLYFYRTVDGGERWTPVELSVPAAVGKDYASSEFSTPVFLGENKRDGKMIVRFGQADKYTAVVYTSRDGGATWQSGAILPQAATPDRVENVHFTDMDHGWVASGRALYRTTDGGATWRPVAGDDTFNQTLKEVSQMEQMRFFEGAAAKGWVLLVSDQRDRLSLLQTSDSGDTWKPIMVSR